MTRAEDETLWRQCLRDMGGYLQTVSKWKTDGLLGEDFYKRYPRQVVRDALEYCFGNLHEETTGNIEVSKD